MRTAEVKSQRDVLVELRDRLTNEVDDMISRVPDQANMPGELSRVPTHLADHDSEGLDTAFELIKNERGLLDQVEAAIERINAGTYGQCERCGEPIAELRLEAIPYTPYCIRCAAKLERRANERGPGRPR